MSTVVVLAMHGALPADFPRPEIAEFFSLGQRLERGNPEDRAALQTRRDELEARMRSWPRRQRPILGRLARAGAGAAGGFGVAGGGRLQ